ncbi:putative ferroportin1 (FPN1) [Lyophyllum shimeji]|uniref:Solute carrier family 40 member n=1 Tax=Lyophyllum shimeji TaxID=47721 RepID=A0A9P3PSC3_LYOSH|nr:putative ferroportin1 (FPN1) [Lyophyllum shimeji]
MDSGTAKENPESTEILTSQPADSHIDRIALYSLAAQHLSITWSQRTAEFVSYIFLIELFPASLLPSALYGFFSTLAGVLFGGNVGSLVDHPSRLKVIRINIVVAKLAVTSVYAFLLVLLTKYPTEAKLASRHINQGGHPAVWILFTLTVLSSCVMKLSDIVMSVAIERDWVTTIAAGSDARLTRLNLWMRRIDLGCKLLAPLFAGLLTSTIGNVRAAYVLCSIALGGLGFEFLWINIVWKRFPVLAADQRQQRQGADRTNSSSSPLLSSLKDWIRVSYHDWTLFIRTPIFPTSLAISLLYFTTLSFDGNMISWLKTNTYSDALISGMRGIAVCTGLAGTAIMPVLEKKIGLTRAGSWSIWSEVASLVPVVVAFYVGSKEGAKAPAWNQALLFGGVAVSRIGLWSFDLCQLKLLQKTLADHPRRNTLNGLQYALQSFLDLFKYVMVIVLSKPSEFKYTATLSLGAVVAGACLYTYYLRWERGHLVHTDWLIAMKTKLT